MSSIKGKSITSFPANMVPVTPSDTEDLPGGPSTIYVGAAGDVAFIPAGALAGSTPIVLTLAAKDVIPCVVRRVMDTDTDNTAIYAIS